MSTKTRFAVTVERAIRSVTDNTTGHFDSKAARSAIRSILFSGTIDPDVADLIEDTVAENAERQYLARRKPRPGQGDTLFDPTSVLSLGDGDRVFMDDATADDLEAWALCSQKNRQRVVIADDRTQAYVAERQAELRAHPGWTLGRVERELYDWTWDHAENEDPDDEDED